LYPPPTWVIAGGISRKRMSLDKSCVGWFRLEDKRIRDVGSPGAPCAYHCPTCAKGWEPGQAGRRWRRLGTGLEKIALFFLLGSHKTHPILRTCSLASSRRGVGGRSVSASHSRVSAPSLQASGYLMSQNPTFLHSGGSNVQWANGSGSTTRSPQSAIHPHSHFPPS